MKLEKKHWVIIGVVVAIILVWYFFFKKKKTESGYATKRIISKDKPGGGSTLSKTANATGVGATLGGTTGTASREIHPVAPVGCPSGQCKCSQIGGGGTWACDPAGTVCCTQVN